MTFFASDLRRALKEPSFIISLFIALLILGGSFVYSVISGYSSADELYKKSQSLVFPFAAAVLAALPYSSMIMLENHSRFRLLMTIKMRSSSYEIQRFFVCGIMGAITIFTPQLVLMIVSAIYGGGFSDGKEIILGTVLGIAFGFAYAVLAYGLTFFNQLRYLPTIIPQVLYMLFTYAFPHLNLLKFYPPLSVSPWIYGGTSLWEQLAILSIISLIALIMTVVGVFTEKKIFGGVYR